MTANPRRTRSARPQRPTTLTPAAVMDAMIDPHAVLSAVREAGTISDFTIEEANAAAVRSPFISPGPVVGRRLTQAVPEAAMVISALSQVMLSGQPLDLDGLDLARPGRPSMRLLLRAVPDGPRVRLTWRDVTEQHDTSRRLAVLLERYSLLIEHSGAVVVATDEHDTITGVSPAVTGVLGWHPADLLGHPLSEFTHPDDTEAPSRPIGASGPPTARPARLRGHHGTYSWFTMASVPLHSGDSHKRLVLAHPGVDSTVEQDGTGLT